MYCKELKQRQIKQSVSRIFRILKEKQLRNRRESFQNSYEAQEVGKDERVQPLPSIGLKTLSSMVSLLTLYGGGGFILQIHKKVLEKKGSRSRRREAIQAPLCSLSSSIELEDFRSSNNIRQSVPTHTNSYFEVPLQLRERSRCGSSTSHIHLLFSAL